MRIQEGKGFTNKLVNNFGCLKELLIKAGFLGHLGRMQVKSLLMQNKPDLYFLPLGKADMVLFFPEHFNE